MSLSDSEAAFTHGAVTSKAMKVASSFFPHSSLVENKVVVHFRISVKSV
jgi:hypothetical protein